MYRTRLYAAVILEAVLLAFHALRKAVCARSYESKKGGHILNPATLKSKASTKSKPERGRADLDYPDDNDAFKDLHGDSDKQYGAAKKKL